MSERPAGRVVRVGARPEGVAVDPASGLAAVATADGVICRRGHGRRAPPVRLPAPARHLSLARPGGPFLVPLENADALAEVSPAGRVRLTPAGGHPHDAAAAGEDIYVGDEFGGTLSLLRGGKLERQVAVDVQPGGVAVTGAYVAVVSVRAYTLELLRRSDLARLGAQSAGYGPSHVVADAAGRLYVADTRGDGVSVFETRPRLRFVARLSLPGSPYGLAVDDARERLWSRSPPATGTSNSRSAPSRGSPGHSPRYVSRTVSRSTRATAASWSPHAATGCCSWSTPDG